MEEKREEKEISLTVLTFLLDPNQHRFLHQGQKDAYKSKNWNPVQSKAEKVFSNTYLRKKICVKNPQPSDNFYDLDIPQNTVTNSSVTL